MQLRHHVFATPCYHNGGKNEIRQHQAIFSRVESTSKASWHQDWRFQRHTEEFMVEKSPARNLFSRVHRIHSNCLKISDMVVEKGNNTPLWRIFPSIVTIWQSLAPLTFWLIGALFILQSALRFCLRNLNGTVFFFFRCAIASERKIGEARLFRCVLWTVYVGPFAAFFTPPEKKIMGIFFHGTLRYPPQSYPPQEIRPY